jgi:hypothetical protein
MATEVLRSRAIGCVASGYPWCAPSGSQRLAYPAPLRAPCGSAKDLSFRGPATPPPDECDTRCRAEESTVGPREGRRGSPRHRRGGETVRQGRCGASRQVPRTPKVDSSVARQHQRKRRDWGCALPGNDRLGACGQRALRFKEDAHTPLARYTLAPAEGFRRAKPWGRLHILKPAPLYGNRGPSVARNWLRSFRLPLVRSLRKSALP